MSENPSRVEKRRLSPSQICFDTRSCDDRRRQSFPPGISVHYFSASSANESLLNAISCHRIGSATAIAPLMRVTAAMKSQGLKPYGLDPSLMTAFNHGHHGPERDFPPVKRRRV